MNFSVAPKLAPFSSTDEPLLLGDYFQLNCVIVQGDFPVNTTWLLNNEPYYEVNGISVQLNGKRGSSLNIDAVTASHAGDYTCIAVNKAGNVSSSTTLVVKGLWFIYTPCDFLVSFFILNVFFCLFLLHFIELPLILPLSLSTEASNEGDYVQLTCIISKGDLPLKFDWFLENNLITNSLATTLNVGRQTSLLIIQSVSSRHSGNYTCTATNSAGSSSQSAKLAIKGR